MPAAWLLASAAQSPPGFLVDFAGDPQPLVALEPARGSARLFLAVAVDIVPVQVAGAVEQALHLPAVADGAAFTLLHGGAGVGTDDTALVQFAERADRSGLAFVLLAAGPVPDHEPLAVFVAHLALPIVNGIAHGGSLAEDRRLAGRLDFFRFAAVVAISLCADRQGQHRSYEQGDSRARSPTHSKTHGKYSLHPCTPRWLRGNQIFICVATTRRVGQPSVFPPVAFLPAIRLPAASRGLCLHGHGAGSRLWRLRQAGGLPAPKPPAWLGGGRAVAAAGRPRSGGGVGDPPPAVAREQACARLQPGLATGLCAGPILGCHPRHGNLISCPCPAFPRTPRLDRGPRAANRASHRRRRPRP